MGRTSQVLVAEGEGRKDGLTHRMSGRAPDGRLIHFQGAVDARPGDCVDVLIESAAPHHLVGTGLSIRTTRAGDAWAAGQGSCQPSVAGASVGGSVSLGMPALRIGP